MLGLLFFTSFAFAQKNDMAEQYCRANFASVCQASLDNSTLQLCQLSISQCKASFTLALQEQSAAHSKGKAPLVTPALLINPELCANRSCPQVKSNKADCPETGPSSIPGPSVPQKKSQWAPVFSAQAIIRVQSGSKVNVAVADAAVLDIQGAISSFMAKNNYTIDQALEATRDREFIQHLNMPKENSEVLDAVRVIMGMDIANAQNYLKAASAKFSFDQKAKLLSTVLNLWLSNYDNNRSRYGQVSFDDMMKAGRNTLRGQKESAGVCRDIHQEAAKLAKSMGIEHAYGISYNTLDTAHNTLVISDPNDRTKIYKLNYGVVSQDRGCTGVTCLEQHGEFPSNGTTLKIWSAQDELMFSLPTTIGASLHRATGGNASELFPLYEYQDSFADTKIKTGPFSASAFYSNHLNAGRSVGGVALALDQQKIGPISFGAGGAAFSSTAGDGHAYGAYARSKVSLNTPTLHLGEMTLRGAVGGNGHFAAYYPTTKYDASAPTKPAPDYSLMPYGELVLKNKTQELNTTVSTSFYHTSHPRDVRAAPTVTRPVISFSYDNQFKISRDLNGHLQISGSVISLDTGLHPNLKAKGTISHKYVDVSLDLGRSLRSNTPLYIPGAAATASASVVVKVRDGIMLSGAVGVNECVGVNACVIATGGFSLVH